jgi:hypothetical protein
MARAGHAARLGRLCMDGDIGPSGAIEFPPDAPGFCPLCMRRRLVPGRVRVVDISQVKAGWIVRGEIELICPNPGCAFVYSQIERCIPVECAPFPCPSCGSGPTLIPGILNITEIEAGYSFIAVLKCNVCSKSRSISKLMQGLSKVTKLKIGPTGLEIEVKP